VNANPEGFGCFDMLVLGCSSAALMLELSLVASIASESSTIAAAEEGDPLSSNSVPSFGWFESTYECVAGITAICAFKVGLARILGVKGLEGKVYLTSGLASLAAERPFQVVSPSIV
jgi:hypothetical protein